MCWKGEGCESQMYQWEEEGCETQDKCADRRERAVRDRTSVVEGRGF